MLSAIYVWLRITLSYCVVGALISTLYSAYVQTINAGLVLSIISVFFIFGAYKAEIIRRQIGLNTYLARLAKQAENEL